MLVSGPHLNLFKSGFHDSFMFHWHFKQLQKSAQIPDSFFQITLGCCAGASNIMFLGDGWMLMMLLLMMKKIAE